MSSSEDLRERAQKAIADVSAILLGKAGLKGRFGKYSCDLTKTGEAYRIVAIDDQTLMSAVEFDDNLRISTVQGEFASYATAELIVRILERFVEDEANRACRGK